MSEIGSGSGSSYPGALDTDSTQEVNSPNAGKTKARAEVPNDLGACIVAIETELGTDPAGTKTNVKTYMQTEHGADGTHGDITPTSIDCSGTVEWFKGSDVASATALALGSGNIFDITGTTTITSIDTVGIGMLAVLRFTGALILTHHATDLILPGAANITTVAGDEAIFVEYATGDWRCVNYQVASIAPATYPSFSVHRNGVDQTITSATFTKIEFTTEEFDTNSDFDSSTNYRFTPTVAGKYLLTAGTYYATGSDAKSTIFLSINKNGTQYKIVQDAHVAATEILGAAISIVADANGSSDYFEVFVYHSATGSEDIEGNADATWFTGCRVG